MIEGAQARNQLASALPRDSAVTDANAPKLPVPEGQYKPHPFQKNSAQGAEVLIVTSFIHGREHEA